MDERAKAQMAREDEEYLKAHGEPGEDAEETLLEPGDLPPFWQPVTQGEAKVGELRSIRPTKFGDALHLLTAEGMISIPIGAAMADLDFEKHVGRILTVTFTGTVETKAGRQLRTFRITAKRDKTPF